MNSHLYDMHTISFKKSPDMNTEIHWLYYIRSKFILSSHFITDPFNRWKSWTLQDYGTTLLFCHIWVWQNLHIVINILCSDSSYSNSYWSWSVMYHPVGTTGLQFMASWQSVWAEVAWQPTELLTLIDFCHVLSYRDNSVIVHKHKSFFQSQVLPNETHTVCLSVSSLLIEQLSGRCI